MTEADLAKPNNIPSPVVTSSASSFRRVAWITPDYPPDRGGVSDHSGQIVNALRASGRDVLICARPHEGLWSALDDQLAAYRPDLVVVAYTPLGYAPRTGGIAPAFVHWSVGMRKRLRCQAILLAHEVGLPVEFHLKNYEFKLAALGALQAAQFLFLAANYDAVLFSNSGTKQAWAQRVPLLANRFHTVRICSNIPYNSAADPAAALAAAGYSVPQPTILFFGTGHQSVLLDYVERAFLALLEVEPSARLVVIGMSSEKLYQLRPSLVGLAARTQALGYLSADQVSLWLRVATLVLAPLIEGVNARKGTVMAALQHGRAVVTTLGSQTRDDIAWSEVCFLAPLDHEAFAATAVLAFRDAALRAAVGNAARAEYEANASSLATAKQILEYADWNAHRNKQ